MKHKHIIACCMALLYTISKAQAQTIAPTPNELDEQYTPKGKSILSSDDSKAGKKSSGINYNYPKNICKVNVGMFVRSIAALHYERNFGEHFSLCGGIGISYGKDLVFKALITESLDQLSNSQTINSEITPSTVYDEASSVNTSLYYSVGPKLIFDNSSNDSYRFLELNYSTYANNFKYIPSTQSNGGRTVIDATKNVQYTFNNVYIKYGTQFFSETKPQKSHEFYVGLGVTFLKYNRITELESTDPTNKNNLLLEPV